MLLATTPTLEGHKIEKYIGIVTSQIVLSTNFVASFFANIRGTMGGRVTDFENALRQAKDQVTVELIAQGEQYGANAIIGIDYDYTTIGKDERMMLVNATGTGVVVRIEPEGEDAIEAGQDTGKPHEKR